MTDAECVRFLQWALPQLRMRWPGFRKVRAQVCKRLGRRISALGLAGACDYRSYLQQTPAEWCILDDLCRITISRFYRDRHVFDKLHGAVLRRLAESAYARGATRLHLWSIGCASGEEPYTLAMGVTLQAQPPLADLKVEITASDTDATLLTRAKTACYGWSSVKDLPPHWLSEAFEIKDDVYRLRSEYRERVTFVKQDVRTTLPSIEFDLILCRNLAFTYFDVALQSELLTKLLTRLRLHGVLVIGKQEALPHEAPALTECFPRLGIYRRK